MAGFGGGFCVSSFGGVSIFACKVHPKVKHRETQVDIVFLAAKLKIYLSLGINCSSTSKPTDSNNNKQGTHQVFDQMPNRNEQKINQNESGNLQVDNVAEMILKAFTFISLPAAASRVLC